MNKESEIKLSSSLFWDVDKTKVDYDKNYQWVICRVLERGTMDDWFAIKRYYGLEKIIEAATTVRYLEKKTMHFISNVFEVPLTEFRCYKEQQLNPELWQF